MSLSVLLFGILSALAVASALVTILSKHPVRAAIALVFHFFMLAGLYLTLNAQFIAAIQVLVYAGAIMVLVIFVIMLLNLENENTLKKKYNILQWVASFLGIAFLFILGITFLSSKSGLSFIPQEAANNATAQALGKALFEGYIFPLEAIGILLTLAIVGAMVLAKRKLSN